MMTVDELRRAYLEFFKARGHKLFSSDSLVPMEDPSLLFTGAGMNQFKPYFLGLKKDMTRATSCQKCLRTGDLERVGKTAYHHTFFEMLGNFSFGDYFKQGAIELGWEFVTKVLKLPQEKLWVSVYQDDDESYRIWHEVVGLPAHRIVRMGAEDNFWPSNAPTDGPNGPCGPCSEIYVGKDPGKGVEIWNLVFTQFDRQSDGSLLPLPQKNIDTGMGLERVAAVIQGVESNFDIDLFQKIRTELKTLLRPGSDARNHENAVMDHVRAVVFSMADGALPSNEGRGYVIRKLIRLASDHLDKAGALNRGTLHRLVPAIVSAMGNAYPEIVERQKTLVSILENEESSYLEVLTGQLPKLREELKQISSSASLQDKNEKVATIAFKYYDTLGLPFELIAVTALECGVELNKEKFGSLLEEQKKRSRHSSRITGEIFTKTNLYSLIEGVGPTEFLGYEVTRLEGAKLLRVICSDALHETISEGEEGVLLFDRSPFYPESGGQVGDTGTVSSEGFVAQVLDTQFLEKCIGHKVRVISGKTTIGQNLDLVVDGDRRMDIMKNHTATHLLHSALRKVLGDHVKQSGSLVCRDYLRFDFTHFSGLDSSVLAKVEALVNAEILKRITLEKKVMRKEEATQAGAFAFFGEKYGDSVRVVKIGDFSMELCGGTHLNSTDQIGLFKIVSEGSIQAGVRRIEAVTGQAAKRLMEDQDSEIESLCKSFGADSQTLWGDLKKSEERVGVHKNRLTQIVSGSVAKMIASEFSSETSTAIVVRRMNGADVDLLRSATDRLKSTGKSFAALFYSQTDGKASLVVAASADLAQSGFNAGKIVKEISFIVGGNGGGKSDFAVGGGKDLARLAEAVNAGEASIRQSIQGKKQ